MKTNSRERRTTVGVVDAGVLAFTAGKDVVLDMALVEADCHGSAAHAIMLSRMPVSPPVLTKAETKALLKGLGQILEEHAAGRFRITVEDQDVHLAIERTLTARVGDAGKKIHTGRSRNDQVALALRLFARDQILATMLEAGELAEELLRFAKRHELLPMVGRTHMQPGMPGSVGLWASSFAEELGDAQVLLKAAYELANRSPLGSAASYGVPLPIDRSLVAKLLGMSGVCHNVLYANTSRGRMESIVLAAMAQAMLAVARLSQDLMIFTMPEFGYFELPAAFCTGSSIMPQKKNPDVLELARAKAARVHACATVVYDVVRGLPSGYNRDLQEAKEPFLEGISTTRACLRILAPLVAGMTPRRDKLLAGFTPDVFATDRALELVAGGMPFRDAYHHVKTHLDELVQQSPITAVRRKTHAGATAGLDFALMRARATEPARWAEREQRRLARRMAGLLHPEP